MSKAIIKSYLDDKTLEQVIEKEEFEDYSERYFDDGYHDYKTDAESVNLEVEINHEELMEPSDISVDLSALGQDELEIAYQSKVIKNIAAPGSIGRDDQMDAEKVKKVQEISKNKKGFTVEDVIARNFQELLLERKEYKFFGSGKKKRTKKSFAKLTSGSLQLGFNLVNCLIGAGILSLAKSCRRMGIIGFAIWLILTGIYYLITWKYYNRAIYLTGSATMGELFSLIFGKPIACIIDICQAIFFFCYMFCYQVITTQYIFGIIQDLTTRAQWNNTLDQCYGNPQPTAAVNCSWHYIILFIIAICFNLPLIIPKSVSFLNKISSLTIFAAATTTFVTLGKTVYFSIKGTSSNYSDVNIPTTKGKWLPLSAMDFFTVAPFITSNFIIHASLPPLFAATKNMSKKTKLLALNNGSYFTCFFSCTLFLIIAISGNIAFDNVSSNILNDFVNPNSTKIDWLSIFCRILMTINVIVSYPCVCFPVTASLIRYIPKTWKIMKYKNGYLMLIIMRLCMWIGTTLCACFMNDIGVVFNVVSSLFSVPILYLGPLTIMMLWPRFEILGDPRKRKLSVVDNIIYNKFITSGNEYFTNNDVERALGIERQRKFDEKKRSLSSLSVTPSIEGEIRIEKQIIEQLNATSHEDGDELTIVNGEIEMQKEKSIGKSDSSLSSDTERKLENKVITISTPRASDVGEVPDDHIYNGEIEVPKEMLEDVPGIDLKANRKNKFIKLPNAHVPIWRYIVFGTVMFVCSLLCFISIIGTIMEEIQK